VPFNDLVNPQQLEVSVAGPGDANHLYVCSGLARGSFGLNVPPGQSQSASETWQFLVGPQFDAGAFRRAIATASFAGLFESDPAGPSNVSWTIQMVIADFDDDSGKVRVSVTSNIQIASSASSGGGPAQALESMLGYNVNILAAIPD
jgi:hypothetical protein